MARSTFSCHALPLCNSAAKNLWIQFNTEFHRERISVSPFHKAGVISV